jgi:hypothetical protein
MSMVSGRFVDWVLVRVENASGGKLTRGVNLFDERDAELSTKVQRALTQGLKLAAAVSVPRMERVNRERADDTLQRVSVDVGVVRSALSKEDSLGLAEGLYAAFSGAEWKPAGGAGVGCCDVAADSLTTEVTNRMTSHSFEVSTWINI